MAWYGMDLVPLPIQRRFVFKEAMHGKLSISLRRWGILVRSRNWNGAIPIPQVYLNLGSALCRLDPSLSFSLQRRRRLLLHFSAIAPAAGRRARPPCALRPFGMVVIFGEKGDDRPTDRRRQYHWEKLAICIQHIRATAVAGRGTRGKRRVFERMIRQTDRQTDRH